MIVTNDMIAALFGALIVILVLHILIMSTDKTKLNKLEIGVIEKLVSEFRKESIYQTFSNIMDELAENYSLDGEEQDEIHMRFLEILNKKVD